MKRLPFLCLFLVAASCDTVSTAYVAADRATYEAIAPEYKSYVETDAALDEQAKASRLRTLETWRLRLEAAKR